MFFFSYRENDVLQKQCPIISTTERKSANVKENNDCSQEMYLRSSVRIHDNIQHVTFSATLLQIPQQFAL